MKGPPQGRLRFAGLRTSRHRVLRLMREHGLLAPARTGPPRGPRNHDGTSLSGMLNLPHFAFVQAVVGIDRTLYAVDYPYLTNTGARRLLEELPVSDEDRAKIACRNAEALFHL